MKGEIVYWDGNLEIERSILWISWYLNLDLILENYSMRWVRDRYRVKFIFFILNKDCKYF